MIAYITLNKKGITDFAKERNILLKNTKSDWVFFVDLDEVVSKKLKSEISNLNLDKTLFSGFYVNRKIVFLGKTIGEDKILRLAKKDSGIWKRAVHETWDVKDRVGYLNNYLIHNTAINLHDYILKINSYAKLHASENLKEGKRSTIFKIVFFPFIKFIQNFVYGRGFVFSMLQSFHSFLAWSTLWDLQRI